jgi:hypothetical protein
MNLRGKIFFLRYSANSGVTFPFPFPSHYALSFFKVLARVNSISCISKPWKLFFWLLHHAASCIYFCLLSEFVKHAFSKKLELKQKIKKENSTPPRPTWPVPPRPTTPRPTGERVPSRPTRRKRAGGFCRRRCPWGPPTPPTLLISSIPLPAMCAPTSLSLSLAVFSPPDVGSRSSTIVPVGAPSFTVIRPR